MCRKSEAAGGSDDYVVVIFGDRAGGDEARYAAPIEPFAIAGAHDKRSR